MVSSTDGSSTRDLLEAPFEGGVALEVLAVLVERGRADRLELAARERGLEDRGRVDRALGRAGADEVVELVDEQDDVAPLGDLLHDLLQPLLELAPVLRAGDEGSEVERVDLLALEEVGNGRRSRCAGRGPRRRRSCRRPARRSARGCSSCGGRGSASSARSPSGGRRPGRAGPRRRASSGCARTGRAASTTSSPRRTRQRRRRRRRRNPARHPGPGPGAGRGRTACG